EDGIRDFHVTGVQTCALPILNPARIPENGTCVVRIWQANIQKTIIAHVPVSKGQVQETGDFELDGVTFPAAEIVLEFLDPSDDRSEERRVGKECRSRWSREAP